VPLRVADKTVESFAGIGNRLCNDTLCIAAHHTSIAKWRSVTRDDQQGSQGCDQVQRAGYRVKSVQSIKLGKHNTKTAFPQSVSRNQRATLWLKQHDRMRVMSGRGVHLPQQLAQTYIGAGREDPIKAKLRTTLARWCVRQGDRVPTPYQRRLTRRNQGAHCRVCGLQSRIATAVIAVQVGVDELVQCAALQRPLQQRKELRCVGHVPTVDQCGTFSPTKQYAVTGEPAALENRNACRELHQLRPGRAG